MKCELLVQNGSCITSNKSQCYNLDPIGKTKCLHEWGILNSDGLPEITQNKNISETQDTTKIKYPSRQAECANRTHENLAFADNNIKHLDQKRPASVLSDQMMAALGQPSAVPPSCGTAQSTVDTR